MRRPQHDGQNPRPLHEKATRISRAQPPQRKRAKPRAMTPQLRNSRSSRSTKRGSPSPPPRCARLGEKGLEVLAHHALQDAVLGVAAHAGVPAAAG